MKKILLKNVNLVLENKLMSGSISIFENKIEKIFADNDNLSEITFDEIIDLEGKYLGPAFIDVHTHGADGADILPKSIFKGCLSTFLGLIPAFNSKVAIGS